MANNWLTQESSGLNPDWFSDIRLLSIKFENMVLVNNSFENFASECQKRDKCYVPVCNNCPNL